MSQLSFTNLRHDVRLMHQLRSYELRHFLILLDFAADLRDPTFIPAKRREALRLTLGFGSGEKGRARLRERLCRFEGLDLIEINPDHSISLIYLLDQYLDEEDDFPPASAFTPTTGPTGPERRQQPDRRQPGRTYSMDPAAVRQRERRKQLAESEGLAPKAVLQSVTFEDDVAENVTAFSSKRHAVDGATDAQMSQGNVTNAPQNVTNERDIPHGRVGDVKNVSRGLKESYDSGDVSNVAPNPNVTTNVTPAPAQNVTTHSTNVTPGTAGPTPPPPRPRVPESQIPAVRRADVQLVIRETGDDPAKWKGRWNRLWNQCQAASLLRCWDEGVTIFAWRLKVSPPSGPGALRKKPQFVFGTITALMAAAGTPYEPVAHPGQVPEPPVDAAEAEEIQRIMRETKALWSAEEEDARAVITPLEDILPETEAEREREDEP